MRPILYEHYEQDFVTNGIGVLSDALLCDVTEERNGAYELEMEYPITGIHYADIRNFRIVLAEPAEGKEPEPFRIYKITKPMSGIVTIYAQHISYDLKTCTVYPFQAQTVQQALVQLVQKRANLNNFRYWTDKTTAATMTVREPKQIRSLLGGSEGSLLDVYGGEYEFNRFLVKLHASRGADNGVAIRYGKNMTDVEAETDTDNVYAGVLPFWRPMEDEATIIEGGIVYSGHDLEQLVTVVPLDLTDAFETEPTREQLRARATAFLNSNRPWLPSDNIRVSFVPLWQTEEYKNTASLERVQLCDTVTVEYSDLGVQAKLKVVKTVYDVLEGRYKEIELGAAGTGTLNKELAQLQQTAQIEERGYTQAAISNANRLITGGLGGYVVMNRNSSGEPQEILIMDTDSIETAINVIRMNKNGIAFSNTGYNGEYTTAWTIDGGFVADFITAGKMSANIIEGGILSLGGLDNGNGAVDVFDASGNKIITISKDGIQLLNSDGTANTKLTQSGLWTDSITIRGGSIWIENGVRDTAYMKMKEADSAGDGQTIEVMPGWIRERQRFANWTSADKMRMCTLQPQGLHLYTQGGTLDEPGDYTEVLSLTVEPSGQSFMMSKGTYSNTSGSAANLRINSDGSFHRSTSSSRRYKYDITEDICERLDPRKLYDLPVKTFKYKKDHLPESDRRSGEDIIGFIAEDVREVYEAATEYNEDGSVEMWNINILVPAMLKLIQEQNKRIEELEKGKRA